MSKKKLSKKGKRNRFLALSILVLLFLLLVFNLGRSFSKNDKKERHSMTTESSITSSSSTSTSTSTTKESAIDWRAPSQTKAYPTLQTGDWVLVSTKKQRVYVKRGEQVLYTMYCSTGTNDSPTPLGTYSVEAERGENFYNAASAEGANYWVSFKDHGIYLFHSVPVDQNGQYIESEAKHLGVTANSHGCVRLSVADAKWFYEHALYGMKVVIE
ncbi:L,D-transpeptidase [Vagococcus entomophilus]|uniref:L,D-TPase catalytic domain-containing protein n=1 Tax=Vagococcus entomophilus TaxID=1160095 RepID=A0A430AKX3_9ENTE|nr:L,D-transpeptidase [Vagococcus entomophilus]RSU08716.1 hypothetical protein CBF30_05685 [Vagococcus entomophilus]